MRIEDKVPADLSSKHHDRGVMNGSPFSATYNEQVRLLSFNAEQIVEQAAQTSMVLLSESSSSELKVHKNKKSKKLKEEKAKKSFIEKLKSFFKKPKNTVRYIACNVLNRKGKGPKFCQDIEDPTDPEDPVNPEDPVDPVNPVIPLSGVGTYFYNASGELIRLEAAEGNTVFSREDLGVINSVTLSSSQSISYKTHYNARRVEKLNSLSQNYKRIYQNELQVAAELKGIELSEYIYSTRINIPELVKKSGQTYRVITDHLGSPVLVINTADGTIESQTQYNEWGRVIEETNGVFIPFGFAGGLRDLDTGLVRFGARDYNPSTARWISKDPIGFNGWDVNLYRYVHRDPVNFIDPSGLAESVYSISKGIMSCVSRSGEQYSFGGFVSGNGPMQNDPSQTDFYGRGSIPVGDYVWDGSQGSSPSRRNLFPVNGTNTFGRSNFQTHGCGDRSSCSEGCIAGDVAGLNSLIDNEGTQSTLSVIP